MYLPTEPYAVLTADRLLLYRTLAASPSRSPAERPDGDAGDVRESLVSGKSSAAPGVSAHRRCAWEQCQAGGVILDGAPCVEFFTPSPYAPHWFESFHPGCAAASRRAAAAKTLAQIDAGTRAIAAMGVSLRG